MASISLGVGMTLSGLFFVIIILINILLHHFSKKKLGSHNGSSSKKHRTSRYRTLTTHSISALLVMTWLPFASTFFVIITQENTHPSTMECQSNTILRTVSTFVVNFYLLNFVLNPFLYCITNINFMKFVIKLIKRTCNDKMCAALWSRINADLDISTNVSTLDHGLERSNSNNCNAQGDAGEKVYSNTLTVPDAAARKKLAGARSAESPHGSYTHELEGNTANKIVITVCESNQEEGNVVKCEKEHYSKTAKKGPGKKGWSVKLRSKKKDKTCSASSKSKKSGDKTGEMPVVTVETDDHKISPQTSNQINESTGAELSCQTI